jgi:hypothetical protein
MAHATRASRCDASLPASINITMPARTRNDAAQPRRRVHEPLRSAGSNNGHDDKTRVLEQHPGQQAACCTGSKHMQAGKRL